MGRKTGIDDARDLGMLFEPGGDMHRVAAMALHAHRKRLDAAQREEGVERTRHAAHGVLKERKLFLPRFVPENGGPADDIGMAQILRRGVHHDVEAQLERPLDPGRGEGVVAHRDELRLRAMAATASRSTILRSGLVGVSTHTMRVSGRMAFSNA